jgi:ribulose-5-phosphate 4-epimerase/fuculose-1-phosphate aldolase
MTDALSQARIDLAAAYRLAVKHGFNEGICNHFTMMVPGSDDRFLLIPYGLHWSEVTASNLIEVDLDGNVISGDGEAEATAFYIHAPIHRARPKARCLLHTHMPWATALTMLEDFRFPMASQNELGFYGRIAYDDVYTGLAFDAAEGDRLAEVMGDNAVLIMMNHGVLIAGRNLAEAYDDLYYLEQTCRTLVLAMSTGQPLKRVPQDVVALTASQMDRDGAREGAKHHFAALKRILDREQPDYTT